MPESSNRYIQKVTTIIHGLTPERIRSHWSGPRVLINSVPKSGTNVLKRCLFLFPMLRPTYRQFSMKYNRREDGLNLLNDVITRTKRGQYSSAHLLYSDENAKVLEEANIKVLYIFRDPRDVVVSHFHWISELNERHRLHEYYKNLADNHARLKASIMGVDGKFSKDGKEFEGIGLWFEKFMPWVEKSYTLTIKFEDIIGSKGGGDDKAQFRTIKNIAEHLELDVDEHVLKDIAEKTYFKKARTFRKGTIGDWQNHFNDDNKELLKKACGNWLIKLGYEKDNNW